MTRLKSGAAKVLVTVFASAAFAVLAVPAANARPHVQPRLVGVYTSYSACEAALKNYPPPNYQCQPYPHPPYSWALYFYP